MLFSRSEYRSLQVTFVQKQKKIRHEWMNVDETKAYFITFNFLLNASPHLNHVQI